MRSGAILSPSGDDEANSAASFQALHGLRQGGDGLPYHIVLDDAVRGPQGRVLAMSADPSVAYAAFYAAAREHPDETVLLTYKGRVINRWNQRFRDKPNS